ncbi:MAG: DNA polymerase I [Actinomycetota bacterium]|nr:DNA polymerase I [Actinomycetota bacterium]
MSNARLMLLDGHSLAYRAYFALPVENFSTTTGQPTNAVYGFTSMLINILRDEQPTHVAVAFDISRKTFRSEMFPEYKANRESSPEPFKGQVPLIQEVLHAMGIKVIEADGYEADDVIATLSQQAKASDFEVVIVTGDRDSFQLVDDRTTVLYPRKGMSDLARMTPEAVLEKYGLTPDQYPDFAALRGDPSDNLPGIPGVGEKTATKWIVEYGSLAALVDHADQIGGKVGESLRANLPQVLLNRQLTQLDSAVPMDLHVDDCEMQQFDRDAIDQLFTTLQFRALRERLAALQPSSEAHEAPAPSQAQAVAVVTSQDLGDWLKALTQPVCFALEGTWGHGGGELRAVAIQGVGQPSAVLDLEDVDARQMLWTWFGDPEVAKIGHGVKGPALALLAQGVELQGVVFDTQLGTYVASPGQTSYSLEACVNKFLGRELATATADGQLELQPADRTYLADHVAAVGELHAYLQARLATEAEQSLLTDLEIPLTLLLARVEFDGVAVDRELLTELSSGFAANMRESESAAHAIVGRPFNLGSPKQLQEILFGERDLPKTKKIKTGYTTDAESLQSLFAKTGDPLLSELLDWRDRSKLRQIVEGLIPVIGADGRLHTTYSQLMSATGRVSSSDPNLQTIPIRSEAGRQIRKCFVVGPGYESLMTADYSQIEMRIMAHLSQDQGLIAAFRAGEDLHTTAASQVFGVEPSDVDPEMRRRIKAMSYGLAYGLSAYGLGQQLGVGPDEAKVLMDTYFARFGGVRDYLAAVVEEARLRGYTETILGRRRYLPDLTSDNRQRREMAERMALNAPIQGTAADIIKLAMLGVAEALQAEGLRSRMMLQVHDELVLEVAPGEEAALREVVVRCMMGAMSLDVPLEVSLGLGSSWESAAH